jgi:hypothetical protein
LSINFKRILLKRASFNFTLAAFNIARRKNSLRKETARPAALIPKRKKSIDSEWKAAALLRGLACVLIGTKAALALSFFFFDSLHMKFHAPKTFGIYRERSRNKVETAR